MHKHQLRSVTYFGDEFAIASLVWYFRARGIRCRHNIPWLYSDYKT